MTNYFEHSKKENLAKFRAELSQQSYYDMMRGFYIFGWIVILACQAVSAFSEYMYFTGFLAHLLSGFSLIIAAGLVALTIEGFKYFLFNILFSNLFNVEGKTNLNPIVLFFCIAVSSVSITTSIVGGGTLGIDTAKVTTTESKHDSEIQALRADIKAIEKRNTWRGNTFISGKDKALLHQKEAELSAAKGTKETELLEVSSENKAKETQYRYGFAAFEIVYVLLTLFTYYYKKRSYIEEGLSSPTPISSTSQRPQAFSHIPSQQGTPQRYVQNAANFKVVRQPDKQQVKQPNEIVAQIEEEVEQPDEQQVKQQVKQLKTYHKTCENPTCKKDFDTSVSNQIYCTTECQRKFNEDKAAKKTWSLFGKTTQEGGEKV